MPRTPLLAAAAVLLLALPALAGSPNTGASWDDSHMRSRHAVTPLPKTRPPIILGDADSTSRREARTLPSATWHSWAQGSKSIEFGKQAPRQLDGSSLSTGRRGGSGGGSIGSGRGAAR